MTWLSILCIATAFIASPSATGALASGEFADRLRAEFDGQRLADLRARLRTTLDTHAGDADQQIEHIHHEIELAESVLRAPPSEVRPAGIEDYLRAHLSQRARRDAHSRASLAEIRGRLSSGKESPEASANLREWQIQLERDLRQVDQPASGENADGERQVRWRAERARLEDRIADLRADLRYWSALKSGAGVVEQKRRVRLLRQQIKDQQIAVNRRDPAAGDDAARAKSRAR